MAAPNSILYAHAGGNDADDGRSWTTAKRTVLAAYDALPSFQGGGGVVYLGGGARWSWVAPASGS